jgi:hypothetical protein
MAGMMLTSFRLPLAAGMAIAFLGPTAGRPASPEPRATAPAVAPPTGERSFDFLVGEWRVRHRRLPPGAREWVEFDGTCRNGALMDGRANLEEHVLNAPAGRYQAVGLRSYDPQTADWSIWWLDGRYPAGPIDPPVRGRFENGVGTFDSDYLDQGKPMRVRFTWSDITPTSARWQQALSADAGKTWQPNWIMEFQRVSNASPEALAAAPADAGGPRDFDFLVGEWRVDHRYLRAATREWVQVAGTCRHRKLMGGWANLEEHVMKTPDGDRRALGLRAYDPKTAQWSVWWLDGRYPSGPLDPPVRGGFENGIGTFRGETTVDAKPVGMRYLWSHITPASARWEQAYSPDGGKTWDPNWVMEFRRPS